MQHPFINLSQLRKTRGLSKREIAQTLRLGIDVWNKLEEGTVLSETLSHACLNTLANSLHVTIEEFSQRLGNSHPSLGNVCLQKGAGGRASTPQSFDTALARSEMPAEDKQFWRALLHNETEKVLA